MTPSTCPFCGLLCDDLPGNGPATGQCALAERLFQVPATAPALIDGVPSDTASAVARAARLLARARRPLV
nr:hypothetical protein [Thiobacillaceae bacterium]